MRVWDIHPGYLNRQSLLGEHRELHGIVSIIVNGKKGYSRHPETVRWVGHGWALRLRHRQLACEMALRGFTDRSPVYTRSNKGVWPATYIDSPSVQFRLLKDKYVGKEKGRIPIPNNAQELWSHHKYSVLARNQKKYRQIGIWVANREIDLAGLSEMLVDVLRTPPAEGGVRNAVQHMWGHVSPSKGRRHSGIESWSVKKLLATIQGKALVTRDLYLTRSTALSELMAWL